jgi:isopentenyl phosphate kinase
MKKNELVFIKLGGSLITDKSQPLTPHHDAIQRCVAEIAQVKEENPDLRLLIGHGSGSFGHAVGAQYQTQAGVMGQSSWKGFAEVWAAARELNQIVVNEFTAHGLPIIVFPPSAGIIAENHEFKSWDIGALMEALSHELIPVVHGDVVFDKVIGGTIFSTEKAFQYLANKLHPHRILLAGSDPGVYIRPGESDEILDQISSKNIDQVLPVLSGAENTDVTGGMVAKVQLMFDLLQTHPNMEILIFSGVTPGNIRKALQGGNPGTLIIH